MKKYVFFDLDGTLLPMDQNDFTQAYFNLLAEYMIPYGYEKHQLIDAVWAGTKAMMENDGSALNEEVFWRVFAERNEKDAIQDRDRFEAFYTDLFPSLRKMTGTNPDAAETVRKCREKGYLSVLASNPLFPAVATEE